MVDKKVLMFWLKLVISPVSPTSSPPPALSPEPPCPSTPPKLLEKRSKQLVVMPVDSYRGDGPIDSTKLLYKPMETGDSWSSIIGMSGGV